MTPRRSIPIPSSLSPMGWGRFSPSGFPAKRSGGATSNCLIQCRKIPPFSFVETQTGLDRREGRNGSFHRSPRLHAFRAGEGSHGRVFGRFLSGISGICQNPLRRSVLARPALVFGPLLQRGDGQACSLGQGIRPGAPRKGGGASRPTLFCSGARCPSAPLPLFPQSCHDYCLILHSSPIHRVSGKWVAC